MVPPVRVCSWPGPSLRVSILVWFVCTYWCGSCVCVVSLGQDPCSSRTLIVGTSQIGANLGNFITFFLLYWGNAYLRT